ncbi:MAG: proprotein convertase P-domain-containing protein, partial [Planctomycetota bacterium]
AETATPNSTQEFLGFGPDGRPFTRVNDRWQDIRPSIYNPAVGLRFNNDYGFGRVNAGAAVALASVWNNLPPEIEESYETNIRNPVTLDASNNPAQFVFNVQNSEIAEVQHIELLLDLVHGRQGELQIDLISPAGIVHTVNPRLGDLGQGYRYRFTAVKYLGTSIDGLWTVRVTDTEDNALNGFINDVALDFYGIAGRPLLQDCNNDQIEDAYQIALDPDFGDCDGDSVIDACQLASDPSADFDQNNELDTCQIARDPERFDCNGDGVLDLITITESLYFDCNNNQRLDSCDIADNPLFDPNNNGYFDSCEPDALDDTNGTTQAADFTTINLGNDFPEHCGVPAGGDDYSIPVLISEPRTLTATVNSAGGSGVILALRDGGDPSSACLGIGSGAGSSRTLESTVLPAGTYFLVVDSSSLSGDFTLDVVFGEPIPVTCAGDFDGDGDIDLGDFGVFAASFNTSLGDAGYNALADFDSDGDIDLGDFGVFASIFNSLCSVDAQ